MQANTLRLREGFLPLHTQLSLPSIFVVFLYLKWTNLEREAAVAICVIPRAI